MVDNVINTSPLSDEDRVVFYRWTATEGCWDMPKWYSSVYLKTDYWARVKAEVAIWSEGGCRLCDNRRLPMHLHHSNYRHLWQERYCDIIYLCKVCHERHGCYLPRYNCDGRKFAALTSFHNATEVYESMDEKEQRKVVGEYLGIDYDNFKEEKNILVKNLSSSDKKLRDESKQCLDKFVYFMFNKKLGYEEDDREELVMLTNLIERLSTERDLFLETSVFLARTIK